MKPLRLTLLPCLAPLVAGPALAAGLGPFPNAAITGQYAQAEGPFTQLAAPIVATITAGPLTIVLETTAMEAVAAAFGGHIQEAGEAGEATVWLCYSMPEERTLWFYSDGEMGGGKVTMVAIQSGEPEPDWSCADAPATLDAVDLGVPGIGTPVGEVTSRFGELAPDGEGRFGFTSVAPHPVEAGLEVLQDIVFRAGDGLIDAVAVRQESG